MTATRAVSPPAIEVVNLTKRFPPQAGWRSLFSTQAEGKLALDRVSLSVQPGEVFGLLGPNGAGKTTLVKVLSTLVLPNDGLVRVAGLDVVRQDHEVRRRIGVVYGDERTFFLRLSAIDNLRFYAALCQLPSGSVERRIRELLEFVGLTAAAHTRMHHYSSGMKQRVAIARGLLSDPDVLFMDEPTHNLDPLAARELRRLVRERVADGKRTVLLATNIMVEAEDLCDRLAILSHGRIQLAGSIQDMRATLEVEEAHELVAANVRASTVDVLRSLPGVRSVALTPQIDDRVQIRVGVERASAAIPAVIQRLVESGANVWSCSVEQELSLEEMFTIALDNAARAHKLSLDADDRSGSTAENHPVARQRVSGSA